MKGVIASRRSSFKVARLRERRNYQLVRDACFGPSGNRIAR
jgi:hypothetical protein